MIQDVIEYIQLKARSLTGVKSAPDFIDLAAANNSCYVLTYLTGASFGTEAANQARDLVTITSLMTLHGANEVELTRKAEGMLEGFINLLRADCTLGGTVQTINGTIDVTAQMGSEDNAPQLTYVISIPVKMRPVY